MKEGNTYKTKFATGEMFTISKIVTRKDGSILNCIGIYESHKHLGDCPLTPERLIPDKGTEECLIEVCDCCKRPIK